MLSRPRFPAKWHGFVFFFFHLGIFAQADLAPALGLGGMWLDKRYLILLTIQSLSRLRGEI